VGHNETFRTLGKKGRRKGTGVSVGKSGKVQRQRIPEKKRGLDKYPRFLGKDRRGWLWGRWERSGKLKIRVCTTGTSTGEKSVSYISFEKGRKTPRPGERKKEKC